MKIGILTFHSQLNFGGVLQCWALQTVLKQMGHDVVVLDRWMNKDNSDLEAGFNKLTIKFIFSTFIRILLGPVELGLLHRVIRTKRFIHDYLNLSSYHFVDWKEALHLIDVDMIVVGSDQVWHSGNWGDPRPYLLEEGPNIPAVAYAVSFGMKQIPKCLGQREFADNFKVEEMYIKGFKRFKGISCREQEGVELCSKYGVKAFHVLDPTLLLKPSEYNLFIKNSKLKRKTIVIYFLKENKSLDTSVLKGFCEKYNQRIIIFPGNAIRLPIPSSWKKINKWISDLKLRFSRNISIYDEAGPKEFINTLFHADTIITDSFHALIFSIIFEKNVRIIKPQNSERADMFSRITEITDHMKGRVIVENISDAFQSINQEEDKTVIDNNWIDFRRKESLEFLYNYCK